MTELLSVAGLSKSFSDGNRAVRAVDDVTFHVGTEETLGLVGESGCGKSTVGRTVLRLIEPSAGRIAFAGTEVTALGPRALRRLRPDMQIIFQDPFSSLNPRFTVANLVEEPLIIARRGTKAWRAQRVDEALTMVGMLAEVRSRYPHEFSGGQRQRIAIARALILEPKLVVADEAVSALDVSVQAQILNLMRELQRRLGLAMLFISHDLGVVRFIAHRVAVMYLGRIVETGPTEAVIGDPLHPYSRMLMESAPKLDPSKRARAAPVAGELPSALAPPPGCHFHPRCPARLADCDRVVPRSIAVGEKRAVACHLYAPGAEGTARARSTATPE